MDRWSPRRDGAAPLEPVDDPDACRRAVKPACPLFDWYVKPHLDSPSFRNRDGHGRAAGGERGLPLCLLGDDSAIRVRGDKVDVVSTGHWRLVGQ